VIEIVVLTEKISDVNILIEKKCYR